VEENEEIEEKGGGN